MTIREGRREDAPACGRICYEAFYAISAAHNFAPDFPNRDVATGVLATLLLHPGVYVVVAERDGSIIGSNALDERSIIAGVGPVTVRPELQNRGAGRELMLAVMDRAQQRGAAGLRLVQATFHSRSLSLYAKLGFDAREPLSCLHGRPICRPIPGCAVRSGTAEDADACNALCRRVHGHTRDGEVSDAMKHGNLRVVERDGGISAYTTGICFFGHSVAETTRDLEALIASVPAFSEPGFLVPTRNADLLRWCLSHGLRITQPMTLMTTGLYNEPRGAYLPSIHF